MGLMLCKSPVPAPRWLFAFHSVGAIACQYVSSPSSEHQYKHRIKKWKLKKNIPTPKKAALCKSIQTRTQLGKSTVARYKGQNVDTKTLRRHLKTEARRDIALQATAGGAARDAGALSGHVLQFGNRM